MLTWRTRWRLLEQPRSRLRQPEDEFVQWVLTARRCACRARPRFSPPATSGIPLALTHHLKHNRVLHERILLVSRINTDAPHVDPSAAGEARSPIGGGMTRVVLFFGFMEMPDVMEGLRLACTRPAMQGIDPEQITYYFRRVMVIPSARRPAWRRGASRCSRRCTSTPISPPPISACRRASGRDRARDRDLNGRRIWSSFGQGDRLEFWGGHCPGVKPGWPRVRWRRDRVRTSRSCVHDWRRA